MGVQLFSRKNLALIFVISISIAFSPGMSSSVSGQVVGVVCVAPQGTSSSGCPASPVSFPGQAPGTRLIVAINIQGSDALNGFRIFIRTDNTVLNPRSADLNNTLLTQPFLILANCINGTGTGCSLASGDGPGVVDVGAVNLGGLSIPLTTGGLFEITYNVVAQNLHTTISAVPGCIGASVTGLCVTITDGGATPNLETFQAGSYGPVDHLFFPTPAPTSVTAAIGAPTTFTVIAQDTDMNALTLTASGLPTGATFTTSGSNPVTGIFSYTPANGPVSASVILTATDTVDHGTLSATTSVTVPPPDVAFFGGKLSWTHHLSLAKNSNMQTWSAKITNPGTETAYAIVTIQGTNGVLSLQAHSAMITLVAGAALDVPITQIFDLTSVGTKYHFTATIMWGTSPTAIVMTSANSKSGAFAVVS
jgi:hypothetical protein